MRLADFIKANVETILMEWEAFARKIWPKTPDDSIVEPATLRDHAEDILRATVVDMRSDQTAAQQSEKSKGEGDAEGSSVRVDKASERHGTLRGSSGFELWAVVAEYRALRASVLRLWRESVPEPDLHDIDELTRFNECIDQSLAEAVRSFSEYLHRDREVLLGIAQTAQRDAEEANRAKDMFLATLSHELRTPMNAIVGWLSIMRMRDCSEAHRAEGLDVIERNTQAQAQLIEDVLDVSRIVSGKLRLVISDCDLFEAINSGIEIVRPAAEARDITLEVQLDPAVRSASCDITRIKQMVWNLLSNAIKFTPKGGTVRVTLDRDRSNLRIIVSDDGQGIRPEMLPHVFERFRQGDPTSRRHYGGLGLGLSIVKHLVEMHGGTVDAYSDGEGHGATFIVRLPIKAVPVNDIDSEHSWAEMDDDHVLAATTSEPASVRLDGLHILVVDDEPDARRMLLKVLESAGARVTTADSASEALAVLTDAMEKERRPDVLVSDVGMPDQNGYDLIREVRRRGYQAGVLPAVALTAFARDVDSREASSAGFQIHIPKPVHVRHFTEAIARLTGRTT